MTSSSSSLPPHTTIPPLSNIMPSTQEYVFGDDGVQPILDGGNAHEDDLEEDIYRGSRGNIQSPSQSPTWQAHRPSSTACTSTSSSSSSSTGGWGRGRGAIAALVEKAISRWARGTSDSSSTTSSSSSSSDSARGRSRSKRRRSSQRRRSSTTLNHGHDLSPSRIARARLLLEHSRRLPREYILFLPPLLLASQPLPSNQVQDRRTLRTSSTRLILAQLDAVLQRPSRHPLRRHRTTRSPPIAEHPLGDAYGVSSTEVNLQPTTEFTARHDVKRVVKGKGRQPPQTGLATGDRNVEPPGLGNLSESQNPRAWWLDVASPTWDDMRAIGKLLHLHPLTLEDILQQEPREKLELFPRLGYYFVVFRALGSDVIKPISSNRTPHTNRPGSNVGCVNVYLIVFREGICSFHFEDISQHLDRVRNRILQLEETVRMTSDWLAHGLMDSVVDAFLPLIDGIEREVDELDSIVSDIDSGSIPQDPPVNPMAIGRSPSMVEDDKSVPADGSKEKETRLPPAALADNTAEPAIISIPMGPVQLPQGFHVLRVRVPRWGLQWLLPKKLALAISHKNPSQPHRTARYTTLLRMAACRRLVTALTRVLVPKHEVVAQMRKRIILLNSLGGETRAAGLELDIYLGDVQDHIVTMQQALNHYERILSHSHPTYLSHLRYTLSEAKGGMDDAILYLSVVTVCFFATQVVTTLFGTNVHVPQNAKCQHSPGPYYIFGVAVALACLAAGIVLALVRFWWLQAKKKYRRSERI